jgi:predicted alpha/beta superfamily hydrolase
MRPLARAACAAFALAACTPSADPISHADGAGAGPTVGSTSSSSASGGSGGEGGAGSQLDELLAALRVDRDAALLAQSRADGWPAAVEGGYLVVSADPRFDKTAGDHDDWAGSAMTVEDDFAWVVLDLAPGDRYKMSDGETFVADPWSRAYLHDEFGVMSRLGGADAHLERHFAVAAAGLAPRTVRVWLPAEPPTHVLYLADGQNLFDEAAPWGGWHLDESVPEAMLLVAIDNTSERFDEYTHVVDDIGLSAPVGGAADAYAALVDGAVRTLVAQHYREPPVVGVMGSSLGGLVSLHLAQRSESGAIAPIDFAASLSGTVGWGSIGLDNETIIERYAAAGHGSVAIYIDSGGGGSCFDGDGDGIEDDDPDASDNYCETKQLEAVLVGEGYQHGIDLWHWHEPGAEHDEAAWAARVWRPLTFFAEL